MGRIDCSPLAAPKGAANSLRAVRMAVCLGATLALLATAAPALAGTPVTLYVNGQGSATAGCTSPGSAACGTVQQGITAAQALSNSDITLLVGPPAVNSYVQTDTI